jgi:hypothetical protein
MKVSEIMRRPVGVIHGSDTLEKAAKIMLQHDYDLLKLVVQNPTTDLNANTTSVEPISKPGISE